MKERLALFVSALALAVSGPIALAAPAAHASTLADQERACTALYVASGYTSDLSACIDNAVWATITAGNPDGDTINTGILGTAVDGGVNTAILGEACGGGSFNSGILGSAGC